MFMSNSSVSQINFCQSGNGHGGPIVEGSQTVYSAIYKDFCGGQPIQEFFYAALITYNLLCSAGQFMPENMASSSATPGTAVRVQPTGQLLRCGGGPAPSSSVSKMVATAKAVAAELASPPASPETKRNEKRKLKAMTELVESKAKVAKTAELEGKEKLYTRRLAEYNEKADTPSKVVLGQRLASMKASITKLDAELWDFEGDIDGEASSEE
jgi:hypothetical protein